MLAHLKLAITAVTATKEFPLNKSTYLFQKFGSDPAVRQQILETLRQQRGPQTSITVSDEVKLRAFDAAIAKYGRDNPGIDVSTRQGYLQALNTVIESGSMDQDQAMRVTNRYAEHLRVHGAPNFGAKQPWDSDTQGIVGDFQKVAKAIKQAGLN